MPERDVKLRKYCELCTTWELHTVVKTRKMNTETLQAKCDACGNVLYAVTDA